MERHRSQRCTVGGKIMFLNKWSEKLIPPFRIFSPSIFNTNILKNRREKIVTEISKVAAESPASRRTKWWNLDHIRSMDSIKTWMAGGFDRLWVAKKSERAKRWSQEPIVDPVTSELKPVKKRKNESSMTDRRVLHFRKQCDPDLHSHSSFTFWRVASSIQLAGRVQHNGGQQQPEFARWRIRFCMWTHVGRSTFCECCSRARDDKHYVYDLLNNIIPLHTEPFICLDESHIEHKPGVRKMNSGNAKMSGSRDCREKSYLPIYRIIRAIADTWINNR